MGGGGGGGGGASSLIEDNPTYQSYCTRVYLENGVIGIGRMGQLYQKSGVADPLPKKRGRRGLVISLYQSDTIPQESWVTVL